MAADRVAVVGGGIAGLTAAWELARGGAEVVLLEAERRLGGMVRTERRDGFVMEAGPDGFLYAETAMLDLARDLGIAGRVVRQAARGSAVWDGKAFRPMGEGEGAALLGFSAAPEALAQGFASFATGMADVTDALAAALQGAARPGVALAELAPAGGGWRLACTGGPALEARAVVLAVSPATIARLLAAAGVPAARALGEVAYAPSCSVSLAYRAEALAATLEGTGFVAAPRAGGEVRACTYASNKYPGRAPAGFALVRAFLAPGEGDAAARAHAALGAMLGVREPPVASAVHAWSHAIPRYPARHDEAVAEIRRGLARLPPVAIAGNGVDGRGLAACVRSGRAAARRILEGAGA